MIAYSYIERNLSCLDRSYLASVLVSDTRNYSKLAILELCGWIEESMDDIILRAGTRLLKNSKNRKYLGDRVKRNYGFEYEKHFKSMLVSLVGITGFEFIEKKVSSQIVVNFKNELSNLKIKRNSLAHTYVRGATQHYDAPSITISRYHTIADGLREYDKALRQSF